MTCHMMTPSDDQTTHWHLGDLPLSGSLLSAHTLHLHQAPSSMMPQDISFKVLRLHIPFILSKLEQLSYLHNCIFYPLLSERWARYLLAICSSVSSAPQSTQSHAAMHLSYRIQSQCISNFWSGPK